MNRHVNPSSRAGQNPTGQPQRPKLWVLRDPRMLRLAFQAFEDLITLRQSCARKVAHARETEYLFQNVLREPDESGLQRWGRVFESVTASWRLLDDTARSYRLDPAQVQAAYRRMLGVRTTWAGLDPRSPSLPLIDQITDSLRQMLIGYAQAQGPRRQP